MLFSPSAPITTDPMLISRVRVLFTFPDLITCSERYLCVLNQVKRLLEVEPPGPLRYLMGAAIMMIGVVLPVGYMMFRTKQVDLLPPTPNRRRSAASFAFHLLRFWFAISLTDLFEAVSWSNLIDCCSCFCFVGFFIFFSGIKAWSRDAGEGLTVGGFCIDWSFSLIIEWKELRRRKCSVAVVIQIFNLKGTTISLLFLDSYIRSLD